MKKYLILSILLSSTVFAADIDLYTSAVIKLVKENKKIDKRIIKNEHNIVALKAIKSSVKTKYLTELKEKTFKIKTEKERKYIAKIDSFISNNQ